MHSVLLLGERVQTRVIERHAEAITGLLDALETRVVDLSEHWKQCSYATALGHYVEVKITAHHLQKKLDREFLAVMETVMVQNRVAMLVDKIKSFKDTMYGNVCNNCSWCDTRKKNWPQNTTFKIPPVNLKSGLEMIYGK